MSSRVSRLSESSDSSGCEGDVKIPTPPPPVPVRAPAPAPVPAKPAPTPASKAAEEAELDAKYNKRYTSDDPTYAESLSSEPLPPPVCPEYRGRSFRGGHRGGGGGHHDGNRHQNYR